MIIIYNIILTLLFICGFPLWVIIAFKDKYKQGILRKFAWYLKKDNNEYVMVHGVSVGEINTAIPFIERLKKNNKVLVTSSTLTGFNNASVKLDSIEIEYFPLDFIWSVKRFFNLHIIKKIYILETEIWPNFANIAKSRNIPIYVINGRISSQSFPKYQFLKPFLQSYFNNIEKIFCGSQTDQLRFEKLGVDPNKLEITQSMKYDAAILARQKLKDNHNQFQFNRENDRLYFVAGSTQEIENLIVLKSYLKLKKIFTQLKLILVPRKPSSLKGVISYLQNGNIAFNKKSLLLKKTGVEDILLVDTIGDLFNYYSIADIVFVGKSLIPSGGGQNPIEPCVLGKAVVMGDSYDNFKDIVDEMVANHAIEIVVDEKDLFNRLKELLQNKSKRDKLGINAEKLILSKTKACDFILDQT